MGLNIVQLRKAVRKPVGLEDDDPELTNDDVDLYLNRSLWELMDKYHFREKERTGIFQTTIGVTNYEMPQPFEALRQLAVVDIVSQQHTPLDLMSAFEYETRFIDGENEYGKPQKYLRENCYAKLWPTPDKVYDIVIRKWATIEDLTETNSTPVIPQVWHELIPFGAVWRVLIDQGDFARAQAMKAFQADGIDTIEPVRVKELESTQLAGLQVIGRKY